MEGTKPSPLQRAATTQAKPTGTAAKVSLYERLGGESAIKKVVDDFVAEMVADPKIREPHKKHFMDEEHVPELKKKLVDQIGEATGGPQKYTGRNMKDAHKGQGITNADFDATVAVLIRVLDKNKVGAVEKDELLALLGPMRKDVVEKAD
jgi:hemoglobin